MMRPGPEPALVLVVDDEDGVRETMRDLVQMFGYAVMTAANGAEALALLADHRPCLIVLDLLMPSCPVKNCSRRCSAGPRWLRCRS
jgi:CheY-like chemotaxis protein